MQNLCRDSLDPFGLTEEMARSFVMHIDVKTVFQALRHCSLLAQTAWSSRRSGLLRRRALRVGNRIRRCAGKARETSGNDLRNCSLRGWQSRNRLIDFSE